MFETGIERAIERAFEPMGVWLYTPILVYRGSPITKLAESKGESLNATILHLLQEAVGYETRRERLLAGATWTDEEAARFEEALKQQRAIGDPLWK